MQPAIGPCAGRRVSLRFIRPTAQVNRVLDLRQASKMEQIEAALAALGLRLIVNVAKAA